MSLTNSGRSVAPLIAFTTRLRRALLVAVTVAAPGAFAADITSLIQTGPNQASDENRDYLIDRNLGAPGDWDGDPATPDTVAVQGQIDVGDSLRGALIMNTLNSSAANVGGNTGNNEWSGIYQARVVQKSRRSLGADGQPNTDDDLYTYVYGTDPAFEADLSGGVAPATGFVPGPGAMVVFFEDDNCPSTSGCNAAGDFDDPGPVPPGPDDGTPGQSLPPSSADVSTGPYVTEEAFVALHRDGEHYWTLGFAGNPNEGWVDFIPNNDRLLRFFNIAAGVGDASINAGLSRLSNNPGIGDSVPVSPTTAGAFGPVEFALFATLRGVADLDTPFELSSDLNMSFFVDEEVPDISIEKFTNGRDADGTNGADDGQPTFTVGSTTVPTLGSEAPIVWTYAVTNSGAISYDEAEVAVTDEVLTLFNPGNPAPVRQMGAPTLSTLPNAAALLAQLGGTFYDDGDNLLGVGEIWEYEATGDALDLSMFVPRTQDDPPDSPVVLGCDPSDVFDPDKKGYNNTGVVTVPGAEDSDPSNYCQRSITIEKFTNGRDADDTNGAVDGLPTFTVGSTTVPTLGIGDPIAWTYAVTNNGAASYAEGQVAVSDEVLSLFNPGNPVPGRAVGAPTLSILPNANVLLAQLGGTFYDDGDNVLQPGEVWEYQADGVALDLFSFDPRTQDDPPDSPVVLGCDPDDVFDPDKNGYNNTGVVTVPGAEDSDPSNYCPEPEIAIEKFTNGRDADGTNGADDGQPTFTVGSTTVPRFDVGDPITWTYAVTNPGNVVYSEAEVEVTDEVLTLFNPGGPAPARQVGAPTLSNLPNAATLLAQLGGAFYDDGDGLLEVGEVWEYEATGNALDLSGDDPRTMSSPPDSPAVLGCDPDDAFDPDKKGYNNIGVVTTPDDDDSDPSNYCPEPGIAIEKFTNGRDADDTNGDDDGQPEFTVGSTTVPSLSVGDPVIWTYAVTNTGALSYLDGEVEVTDEVLTLFNPGNPEPTRVVGAPNLSGLPNAADLLAGLGGAFYDDGDDTLDPGEVWEYEATGALIDLTPYAPRLPGAPVNASPTVLGCNPDEIPGDDLKGYNNVGVVTVPGDEASDPSNACPEPGIDLVKFTVGLDSDDTNGADDGQPAFTVDATEVPTFTVGQPVTWTYSVLNCGNVELAEAQVLVNDAVLTIFNNGVVPVRVPEAPDLPDSLVLGDGLPKGGCVTPSGLGDESQLSMDTRKRDDGDAVLEPGEVWEYRASAPALDLTTYPVRGPGEDPTDPDVTSPVVLGCNPDQIPGGDRKGYNNVGEVMIPGLEDTDPANYCVETPECDLEVVKTCVIPKPPTNSLPGKCKGKIQEFTLIWGGPNGAVVMPGNGMSSVSPSTVNNGDEVTFIPDGSSNDVFVSYGGAQSGESKFHMSCSDKDMNADNDNDKQSQVPGTIGRDCGKLQGNGKSTDSSLVNDWLLEGLIDAEGLELDCTASSADDFPTEADQCVFTPVPEGGNCSDIKPIDGLVMQWNGVADVDIIAYDGSVGGTVLAQINDVSPGEYVVVEGIDGGPNDQQWEIFNAATGAKIGESEFHVSCSDDDMDGPEDCPIPQGDGKGNDSSLVNTWGFGGMIGETGAFSCPGSPGASAGSTPVVYGFEVTNPNADPIDVLISDADLGIGNADLFDENGDPLPTPATIPANGTLRAVTGEFVVTPDGTNVFKNTVTVTGQTLSGAMCEAMDMVEVKREPPPPPPVSCSDIKPVTAVSVVWDGTGAVDVVMESGETFLNVLPGNQITFQEAGTGNDVEMDIFEAGTSTMLGASKFHVSCSDAAMNGSEDCGSDQGNGKGDESNLVNDWLFDGMTGENGSFACNVPNTGVVDPSAGGGPGGGGGVVPVQSPTVSKNEFKWKLVNENSVDVFVTMVEITWPGQQGDLKELKLDGDKFGENLGAPPTSGTFTVADFVSDANKRKMKDGEEREFKAKFDDDYEGDGPGDYTVTITFDNGDVVSF